MATQRIDVVPGQRVRTIAPYSEVCMHMGVAGRPCTIELVAQRFEKLTYHSAIIRWTTSDGRRHESTVTTSEAGFYQDNHSSGYAGYGFYTYEDWSHGDDDPKQVQADMTKLLRDAMSGPEVVVITNLGL